MNVCLLTSVPMIPPWDQGDKNLAYTITSALPQVNFGVLTTQEYPVLKEANLHAQPLYRSSYPDLWEKARVYRWLLAEGGAVRNSRIYEPDLFHLIYRPYHFSSLFMRLAPALKRHPTLHTMPATADHHPVDPSLFFADRVVTLSEHGKQRLLKAGVSNVVHIPIGIQLDPWIELHGQEERFKAQLGWQGHPVLLFPGHYGPLQGSEVMSQALPLILQAHPEARFIFACRLRTQNDKAAEAALRRQLAEQGLEHAVQFFNTVTDMRLLIGASDLVLLPLQTLRDKIDIPTTLIESLAAGHPIVISDLAPMNEILNTEGECHGCVGLSAPPGDAIAFAQAVIDLLDDPSLRKRMGECGQLFVRKQFDIRQVAKLYHQIYQDMV